MPPPMNMGRGGSGDGGRGGFGGRSGGFSGGRGPGESAFAPSLCAVLSCLQVSIQFHVCLNCREQTGLVIQQCMFRGGKGCFATGVRTQTCSVEVQIRCFVLQGLHVVITVA